MSSQDKDNLSRPPLEVLQTSEIRYRRLFESARDGILILDADTRKITDVNPFMMELLEYTREEFLGKELWQIGVYHDKQESVEAFSKLRHNGYIRYEDLPLKTKAGLSRDVEFVSNVYLESGREVIQCNIRDITQRKRVEKERIESVEKYRNIVETANEGIWLIDSNDRTSYVNAQMAEMLGYTINEMIGRPIYDFLFENDFDAAKNKVKERKTGTSETDEFRLRRKDGSEIITLYNASPTKNQAGEVIGFLSMNTDITEIRKAEEARWQAETNFRNLIESSPGIVYLNEPVPPYSTIYVSPNVKTFGYSPEEWYAKPDMWSSIIHSEDRERVLHEFKSATELGLETELEYRIVAREGTIHWWQDKGRFVFDEEGNKAGWQGIILDITATKELEKQLRQAQKLESIGILAGGIAHDFNNMLTAINGYAELTLRRLNDDDPLRGNLEEIRKAGLRSAALTGQLLAFSRQQVLQPAVLDVNTVITDTIKMLQRLIGEDIQLNTILDPKIGRVVVDPGQFAQIIMNLAVNARDAIQSGGTLTIVTSNVFLDTAYTRRHIGLLPGAYVLTSVSDNGIGMSQETKKHMFEPFFTTKEIGHGTGLGLATVYGIIKQSGGNIEVDSEEGSGTTFKIYLPRVGAEASAPQKKEVSLNMPAGTETILLVEDEELVRTLSKHILEECGYKVIEAANGVEALKICDPRYSLDLLMTDVVMPEMGGRELSVKMLEMMPGLRILFTSGYTDDNVLRHGVIEIDTNFIQKPFTPSALANKIRDILDSS